MPTRAPQCEVPRLRLDRLSSSRGNGTVDSPRTQSINQQKQRAHALLQARSKTITQRAARGSPLRTPVLTPRREPEVTKPEMDRRMARALATERARAVGLVQQAASANDGLQERLLKVESSLEAMRELWREEHAKRVQDNSVYQEAYASLHYMSGFRTVGKLVAGAARVQVQRAVSCWVRNQLTEGLIRCRLEAACARAELVDDHEAELEHHLSSERNHGATVLRLADDLRHKDQELAELKGRWAMQLGEKDREGAVSYTHLTLPTKRIV
eukprot:TRINITY_DN27549_c0_g1_i1.p1 TRINITY_DN27549_c0_g1~~TRINITY_DN27549_c0_g1_i1.p1  ORF type:complete len:270 (+),score=45.83 TRINITY_DN27549_c0_g1_i1:187-996(+)